MVQEADCWPCYSLYISQISAIPRNIVINQNLVTILNFTLRKKHKNSVLFHLLKNWFIIKVIYLLKIL